jgi:putative N-acetylmannosamine-6-phosphate epimerase
MSQLFMKRVFSTSTMAKKALELGAYAVIVGTAITGLIY